MAQKKKEEELNVDTQTKIKHAARMMFHKKGFAATRTRDIASEADINIALLNYYFRSKQKLFDIIMMETMQAFFQAMIGVLNDEQSSFKEKVTVIANNYIELLLVEPEIPLFLMNEVRNSPSEFFQKLPLNDFFLNSILMKQYKELVKAGKIMKVDPIHFLINLLGLTVFPFVASPMVKKVGALSDKEFQLMMIERKKLIPIWIKGMLKAK
jgi:AcrR family transcriptional regulator